MQEEAQRCCIPITVSPNLCSPKIHSKKNQQPPVDSFIGDDTPPPTPAHNNSINYELIPKPILSSYQYGFKDLFRERKLY